jgi:hypothetical protein
MVNFEDERNYEIQDYTIRKPTRIDLGQPAWIFPDDRFLIWGRATLTNYNNSDDFFLPKNGYSWGFFSQLFRHLKWPNPTSQETYYFRGVPEVPGSSTKDEPGCQRPLFMKQYKITGILAKVHHLLIENFLSVSSELFTYRRLSFISVNVKLWEIV